MSYIFISYFPRDAFQQHNNNNFISKNNNSDHFLSFEKSFLIGFSCLFCVFELYNLCRHVAVVALHLFSFILWTTCCVYFKFFSLSAINSLIFCAVWRNTNTSIIVLLLGKCQAFVGFFHCSCWQMQFIFVCGALRLLKKEC